MYGRKQETWREFEQAAHYDEQRLAAEQARDYRAARRAKARATRILEHALSGRTELR